MTFELKVARYVNENPLIIYNLKRFRALLLDLSENDIPLTNLILTATIDGLHFKIAKLKKSQRKEIVNTIHSFVVRYSIDVSKEDTLYSFYANVFAEKELPEQPVNKEEKVDPIINLNLSPVYSKNPPKQVEDYVPCGVTKQDGGFYIKGINKAEKCENKFASIYAIIFSLLQRSLLVEKSSAIKEYEETIRKEVNLTNTYRLEVILLLLIKNNYDKDNSLSICLDGDKDDLLAALYEINHYAKILSSLSLIKFEELKIKLEDKGIKLSTKENEGDIKFKNEDKKKTITRYQWFENSLLYSINKNNEKGLYTLLDEIFGFDSFLDGQKECLIKILNNQDESSICILPMGGGKSLIYYFAAYLKSCPTFIVSPSKLLITDQLRNLKLFHNIDDAIELSYDMDYKNFSPCNKMMFITPKAFLNRALLCRLIKLNFYQLIGNVVLDEVHCISNWGHDFRPEYLMLSYNLNEFLSSNRYLCFTATANYTVIKDIKDQLNVNIKNIYCPTSLKNNTFNFTFISKDNEDDLAPAIAAKLSEDVKEDSKKRTITFTKTQSQANTIFKNLTEEAVLNVDLCNSNPSSYHDFIIGDADAIICGEAFGIGINMPRINNIIHYGAPLSKSQYAQEIGRAARNKAKSDATVYFLSKKSYTGLNEKILDKSLPPNKLIELYNDNSFSEEGRAIINKLFGNVENKEDFERKVLNLLKSLQKMPKDGRIAFKIELSKDYKKEVDKLTRYLYILFRIGFIFGWYFESLDEKNSLVTFYIDPGKERPSLDAIIETTISYLNRMGNSKKAVVQIKHAKKVEDIVKVYIEWYYSQLLYYHREQYLEMLDFLEKYENKDSKLIASEMDHYFSLSILDVEKDSSNTKKLTIPDVFSLALSSPNQNIVENIKASIEDEYSIKLDLFLFIYNICEYKEFDNSRLARIMSSTVKEDKEIILENITRIYDRLKEKERLEMISTLTSSFDIPKILSTIYEKEEKDVVYYYLISSIANKTF